MRERERVQHGGGGKVITKQAEKAETDINAIVGRYVAHGIPPIQEGREPRYGDFSDAGDYHTQLSRLREAEEQFYALPAAVRELCRNDPGVFVEKALDPDQVDDLVKAGLPEDRKPALPPVDPAEPEAAAEPASDPKMTTT